jgi:hypothetical protein
MARRFFVWLHRWIGRLVSVTNSGPDQVFTYFEPRENREIVGAAIDISNECKR